MDLRRSLDEHLFLAIIALACAGSSAAGQGTGTGSSPSIPSRPSAPASSAAQAGLPKAVEPSDGTPMMPGAQASRVLELTLEEARELGLKNNLGLQIEAITTDVSFYSFKGSFGVYDWTLGANANLSDSKFNPGDVFSFTSLDTKGGGVDLTKPFDTGGTFTAHFDSAHLESINPSFPTTSVADVFSLGFVQPLLRGAWREYTTANQRIADLDWRKQGEHERQVRQKLLLDVSLAYWDLVAAREQLGVAESSLELARTQMEQDRRRLEAGVGTEIDVLQSETKAAQRDENRLQADVRVRQAIDTLKALLMPGKDEASWDTLIVPTTPLPENVSAAGTPTWMTALTVALDRRSELRQQRLLIDTNAVQLSQRESESLPGLSLSFTALSKAFSPSASDSLSDTFSYAYPTYVAAINFSFPLSNTTARYNEKTAWANLRAARLSYDQLESQIVADVRFAVRQVNYQAEAVRAATKSLELARRQLKAGEDRREIGSSTNFEVLQLQQDLAEAMSNERATRVNFGKALVALDAAQGLLGESTKP